MSEAELESRLALSFLIVEQAAQHREQIVAAPEVKGRAANLGDVPGVSARRIARDIDELEQRPVPADFAFERQAEQAFQRIGGDQRLAPGCALLNPARQDRHERLRHGRAQCNAAEQPVDSVAKGLRIAGVVKPFDEEIVEPPSLGVGPRGHHFGEDVEDGRGVELVGVGEDVVHSTEVLDPDCLAFDEARLEARERAHAGQRDGVGVTIDNRRPSPTGTIDRRAALRSLSHWHCR